MFRNGTTPTLNSRKEEDYYPIGTQPMILNIFCNQRRSVINCPPKGREKRKKGSKQHIYNRKYLGGIQKKGFFLLEKTAHKQLIKPEEKRLAIEVKKKHRERKRVKVRERERMKRGRKRKERE